MLIQVFRLNLTYCAYNSVVLQAITWNLLECFQSLGIFPYPALQWFGVGGNFHVTKDLNPVSLLHLHTNCYKFVWIIPGAFDFVLNCNILSGQKYSDLL